MKYNSASTELEFHAAIQRRGLERGRGKHVITLKILGILT